MKNSQQGFGASTALIIIIVLVAIAGVGYAVWSMNDKEPTNVVASNSQKQIESKDFTEGIITIKAAAVVDREEILAKVARPLRDWHTDVVKIELESITVDAAPNQMSADDARYAVSYKQRGVADDNLGFIFGEKKTIDYWVPQLCDDGGCEPYPESFKVKYPETYAAYQRLQQPKDK
jgi:hypothetical protein